MKKLSIEKIRNLILESLVERIEQSSDRSIYDLFYSQCTGFKPL